MKVVGTQSVNNLATFKFKAGTSLAINGGQIQISTPKWYVSQSLPLYPFESAECYSNVLETVQRDTDINDKLILTYKSIS
jgi:hypothetical protein